MIEQEKDLSRKRLLWGICSGVIVGILMLNLLNLIFGWIVLAVVLGLFFGLETGLWITRFEQCKKVHGQIPKKMFGTIVRALGGVSKSKSPIIYRDEREDLALFVAGGLGLIVFFVSNFLIFKNIIPDEGLTFLQFMAFFVTFSLVWLIFLKATSLIIQGRIKKSAYLLALAGIVVLAPLVSVFLFLFFVLMTFIFLVFYVAMFCEFVGRHENMALVVGIVLGICVGFAYGQFTNMLVVPTMLSCVVGCVTGGLAGETVVFLGKKNLRGYIEEPLDTFCEKLEGKLKKVFLKPEGQVKA